MNRIDALTLAGLAVVVYAVANIAHEGLGHGLGCVIGGGDPVQLNAIFFECGKEGFSEAARRGASAAGTLVNLVLGLLAWGVLRAGRQPTTARYVVWLTMTVNLLQATGYWLFSGIGNIGDWAVVIGGLEPHLMWRLILAVGGGVAYWLVVRLSVATLRPMLGDGRDRHAIAQRLTVVPYVVGGMLYVAAGLLNPYGLKLVLISAVAASFGGTSGLAWMSQLLRDEKRYPPAATRLDLAPSTAWALAGLVSLVLFVVLMGRGIRF